MLLSKVSVGSGYCFGNGSMVELDMTVVRSVVQVLRLLSLSFLILFLAIPAGTAAQTYGSGELEYGGIRLQFSGQVSGGTCQLVARDVIQCRMQTGTSGTIQLTATRTPAGTVNIWAVSLPSGWPTFPTASGWGTVSRQYSFTVPSGSAGQRFELRFSAWTPGVVGELGLTFLIDAVAPPAPTPPPAPSPPYTQPVPSAVPKIEVVPDRLDFGKVAAGTQVTALLKIGNIGRAILDISWVTVGERLVPLGPFRLGPGLSVGPFSLSPGGSTLLLVIFSPTEAGEFKDKIIINSNDPQRPQVEIPLTGRGYKEPPISRPDEPAPYTEGEAVPPVVEQPKKCQECPLSVLTQNCQLIPGVTAFYGGTPHAAERAKEIGKLVAGEWAQKYHIICLQEVFNREDKNEGYKNDIARPWFKDQELDLGAEKEAELGKEKQKVKIWWHTLEKDQEIDLEGEKVQLLAKNPGKESAVQQIAVLKKGDRYLVAGPSSPKGGRFTVDGGLVILSRYPVIAASGFTFSDRPGEEGRSQKGALYARIKLVGEPECFIHVFNTHLAAGDEEKYWQHRNNQLKELGEFITNCVADTKDHSVIVCGDFNVDGYSGEYNRLVEWSQPLNLKDAWREKNPRQALPKSPYDDPRKDIPWHERMFGLVKGRDYQQWKEACRDYKSGCEKYRQEGKDEATWVGKQSLEEETPWGRKGEKNVLATEEGNYQRLDYILYFSGSTPLKLDLESVSREPSKKRDKTYGWKGYTVSDHLGMEARFKVLPVK